jgi:hypothetical protein
MNRRDLPPDVAAAVSDLNKAKHRLGSVIYRHGRLLTDHELASIDQAKDLIADVMAGHKNPHGATEWN